MTLTNIRLHLDVLATADESKLHQFGTVYGKRHSFVLKFENVVSNQLLHLDGVQPGFNSLSLASPGSCNHRRRAHQTESGNEATALTGGESVQSQLEG